MQKQNKNKQKTWGKLYKFLQPIIVKSSKLDFAVIRLVSAVFEVWRDTGKVLKTPGTITIKDQSHECMLILC